MQYLEALEPMNTNVSHDNGVRAMALACRVPLQQFLDNLEKYDKTLHAGYRRAKYAVLMGKEVEILHASIAAKVISIHLMLATQSS